MTLPASTPPVRFEGIDDAITALRAQGLRVSTARRLILQALFAASAPLSAEQISAACAGSGGLGGDPGRDTPASGSPSSGGRGSDTPGSGSLSSGDPGSDTPASGSLSSGDPGSDTPGSGSLGSGDPGSDTPGSGSLSSGTQGSGGLGGGARTGAPLDAASVYRNLEVFERAGVVRHVHLGHGPGLYALVGEGEREYLHCERCGTTVSVRPSELDDVRTLVRARHGYLPRFTHFPIVGLCRRCAGERRDD